MKQVQLTEAIPGYLEGEVLTVDENSAESLVEKRKVAKFYDPNGKGAKDVVPHPVAPGANHIVQVVDADMPAPADAPAAGSAPESATGDAGTDKPKAAAK